MVNYTEASLDVVFSALADPTRRAILERLVLGESTVTELAEPFDVSLPAISKQLRVLEEAGLLAREKDGRLHRCRLSAQPMAEAAQWISRYRTFWEKQLDALADYLNESSKKEHSLWPTEQTRERPSGSSAPSPRRARKSSKPGRSRRR